jgi:tetratricopeptide (TPR) repeat protein
MSLKPSTATDHYRLGLASQQRGELETAKEHFLAVLQDDPQHADALHSLGSIDARARRFVDAERLMRRAIALNPMQALYFNSLGNVLRACNRREEAAAVYQQALRLQPDLALVHNNLGALALEDGEPQAAAEHCLEALELDPNFAGAYCNLGRALNNLGKLDEAADAFRRALKLRPQLAIAHNYLGHVQRARGELERARESFRTALEIEPELAAARRNLGTVHMALGEAAEAVKCFAAAVRLEPGDAAGHLQLGIACHTVGRLGRAAASYRAALELEPGSAEGHLNLGIVLNELREPLEAERALQKALELEPGNALAWAELAALYEDMSRLDDMQEAVARALAIAPQDPRVNLEAARCDRRRGRLDEALARLRAVDPVGLPDRVAQQIHYELGLLHDRRNETDDAFRHFTEANRHGLSNDRLRRVDPSRFLRQIDALHTCFSSAPPSGWAKAPPIEAADTPVFLFGFPRSGTTLTDLLLDGHPSVRTLEEKPTINKVIDAIRHNFDGGFPEALARLDTADIATLREVYFRELDRHAEREPGIVIVDKLPIRTVHAGLIWRLFPRAKIVFSLRHPCDVCLSGFMQQYNSNDAFANFFTLEDTVRVYDKVMSLWRLYVSVLALDCHAVRYERLVGDLEGETRRLLRFLGLPWEDASLDYAERARQRGRIWTNSYHQVTEPIYDRARYRWLRYRAYLEPHLERLAPHIAYFGYERG